MLPYPTTCPACDSTHLTYKELKPVESQDPELHRLFTQTVECEECHTEFHLHFNYEGYDA